MMGPERPEDLVESHSSLNRLIWLAVGCLLLAICGAGYLATVSLSGGSVAGCGQESGCNHVLSSRWAYWFGLPVSVPAAGLYLLLFAATIAAWRSSNPTTQTRARTLIFTLGPLAIGAAFWFVLLQAFVLKSWCKVCLATHASVSLAIFFLLVTFARARLHSNSAEAASPRRYLGLGASSTILGLAVLVIGQAAVNQRLYLVSPLSGSSALSGGQLLLHHGTFKLNAGELPRLGSSSATNFIVSVFDYTCTHCRALHPLLMAAESKYSGQLAIISLPMPLDANCNPLFLVTAPANENSCEYARLALAVWRARPEVFREFDDWMFTSPAPPALREARRKAQMLAGKQALEVALSGAWIKRQLDTDIALYQANGRMIGDARLPQLVIGDVVTHGTMQRLEDLTQLLQLHLPLRPTDATDPASSSSSSQPR